MSEFLRKLIYGGRIPNQEITMAESLAELAKTDPEAYGKVIDEISFDGNSFVIKDKLVVSDETTAFLFGLRPGRRK